MSGTQQTDREVRFSAYVHRRTPLNVVTLEDGEHAIQSYASNDSLSVIYQLYHLDRYVNKPPGQVTSPSSWNMASAVEALIGAVWLDCGKDMSTVVKVVSNFLKFHSHGQVSVT